MGAPGLIAAFTAGAATLAGGRALVHWGIRKGLAAPRVSGVSGPAERNPKPAISGCTRSRRAR